MCPSEHFAVYACAKCHPQKLGAERPLHKSIKSLDCVYLLSHVENCWVALKIANLLAMTWNISLDVADLNSHKRYRA